MNREEWKVKLETAFRIADETERNRVLDQQTDELWEIGPIVVRSKNSSNCSDGCCDMDQWVIEEYYSHHDAYWAVKFGDNAIQPVWRIVLDVEI